MNTEQALLERCESKCELCASDAHLGAYNIPPADYPGVDGRIMICDVCRGQLDSPESMDVKHWHCLNSSMWSQVPAVQVMAWHLLKRLSAEGWAQDLLDMLYLDEEILQWAEAGREDRNDTDISPTLDSNGMALNNGDTVTLIKDLDVKGAGFTAKRGTAVRNISLTSNPEQIEGRVNGVRIVLLTQYLKKTN